MPTLTRHFTRDDILEGQLQYFAATGHEPNILLYPPGTRIDGRQPWGLFCGMLVFESEVVEDLHFGQVRGLPGTPEQLIESLLDND